MARVLKEKEMPVGRDFLIEAITDFEKYPEFVTEVVSAKRLPGGTEAKFQVLFELEVVKRFAYTLEFSRKGKELITWHLVESNFFKTNEGAWKLSEPTKGKTFAQYELEVGFGFFVPSWVSKKLTEVNLPKMLDAFEARAKGLQEKKARS